MAKNDGDRALDFVMGFVSASEEWKDQFLPKWQEVLSNFIVEPYDWADSGVTGPARRNPYGTGDSIILKDPETHKVVMTYASKLVRALFGNSDREYIQARPVGYEDAFKAKTVTRLLRHSFNINGHFRVMLEAVVDMLLFGTSIIEVGWRYEEREMLNREVVSFGGVESDAMRRGIFTFNDVQMTVVDPVDFYPDPSEYRIDRMSGCAKRFKMTRLRAEALAESEVYEKAGVQRAIDEGSSGSKKRPTRASDDMRPEQPTDRVAISDFEEMIGYEYFGDVPWADDLGSSRRVITVLNGHVVRDKPYPFADPALPFHAMIINPVNGRFYGVSPAEVIRYDQDFADALKMLTAEAVVRSVHPMLAYDPDADIDVAKLRCWKADLPIPVSGGPNSIATLRYDANFGAAFNTQMMLTGSMQGASGAQGGIQGEEGPDREAATVGAMRIQNAMDRPELAALLIENECLPPIGKANLRRYQQFLSTEELKQMVGEEPEGVWIGDIMGDFDVEFVGSRMAMGKQEKMQAYDRLGAISAAIPELRAQVPWQLIGQDLIGKVLDLPEVAALMGDPSQVIKNLLLQKVSQEGPAGGNGEIQRSEPAGTLPAQAVGGTLDVG